MFRFATVHTAASTCSTVLRRRSGQCEHAYTIQPNTVRAAAQEPAQRNHACKLCLCTGSESRLRPTSCPTSQPVIQSLDLTTVCSTIKHLSLSRPCLYLDKQMSTCSGPVQGFNKGAGSLMLISDTKHWPRSNLPVA